MSADAVSDHAVPDRRTRLVILGICSMSLLIVGLDATIVNVALPAIHRSFHSALSGLQWTIDAYTLVIASLLMLSGSTADRLGRRRVFQCGLALFSLRLAAVRDRPQPRPAHRRPRHPGDRRLDAQPGGDVDHPQRVRGPARARPGDRGLGRADRASAWRSARWSGGALVDSVGWRAVFIVNLPSGSSPIILTALYVPESRAPRPRRIDPVGQLLVIVALATLTYAIIEGPEAGWLSRRR